MAERIPGPEALLQFDTLGLATDGTLRFEGATVDIRNEGFVAVLVSRAAVAPDALVGDDLAVYAAIIRGLRLAWWTKMSVILLPLSWLILFAGGVLHAVESGDWFGAAVSGLILVGYAVAWVMQRRHESRRPLQ